MTLETRAIRGDMREVFKIMNGWESGQESDFFRWDESGQRRHTYKLHTYKKTGCDWIWPLEFSFGNRV